MVSSDTVVDLTFSMQRDVTWVPSVKDTIPTPENPFSSLVRIVDLLAIIISFLKINKPLRK